MRIDAGFAGGLLDRARKEGADHAEVYMKFAKQLSVEVRDQEKDTVRSSVDFGYSLCIIKDGRVGFSYSTQKQDADTVVQNAVESSHRVDRDKFVDMPLPKEHRAVRIYDDSIASMNVETELAKALAIEKAALDFDVRITNVRKASGPFLRRRS